MTDQPSQPSVDKLDSVESLSPVELRVINGRLKADALSAMKDDGEHKWTAFALVCWALAKRRDPAAKLATYENMSIRELTDLLPDAKDDADQDEDEDRPPRTVPELADEAAADPTVPSP